MGEETLNFEGIVLHGLLDVPPKAQGIVLFAHGSGSGRMSPRNQYVAKILRDAGLGTLLMDLLTSEEEEVDEYTRQYRFDIPLLTNRLVGATDWLKSKYALPQGYFGSSTGAAAALIGAAKRPKEIKAVVSRGGRTDLAQLYFEKVEAPTLMIAGGADSVIIELNEDTMKKLHCPKRIAIVPYASHLFEEPGTLDQAALLARDWLKKYVV